MKNPLEVYFDALRHILFSEYEDDPDGWVYWLKHFYNTMLMSTWFFIFVVGMSSLLLLGLDLVLGNDIESGFWTIKELMLWAVFMYCVMYIYLVREWMLYHIQNLKKLARKNKPRDRRLQDSRNTIGFWARALTQLMLRVLGVHALVFSGVAVVYVAYQWLWGNGINFQTDSWGFLSFIVGVLFAILLFIALRELYLWRVQWMNTRPLTKQDFLNMR